MGKPRLSVQRKNGKRMKYGYYRVRIPLTDSISVLPVSLPLEKLSFTVSLPQSFFTHTPLQSLSELRTRITAAGILPRGISAWTMLTQPLTVNFILGWIDATDHVELQSEFLVLCKLMTVMASMGEEVFFNIRVDANFSWSLSLRGDHVNIATSPFLLSLPQTASSVASIEAIVRGLDTCKVCIGNGDDKFSCLLQKNGGKFMNLPGKPRANTVHCID